MAARKDPAAELAEKLLQVLEAQRGLGPDAYPPSLARLAALADAQAAPDRVARAVGRKPFTDRALVAQKKNPAAPVALLEDLDRLAADPRLLEAVLESVCTPQAPAWPPNKLKTRIDARLRQPFEAAVARQIQDDALPPAVGCQRVK